MTDKRKLSPRYAAREHLPKWLLDQAAAATELLAASPYITEDRLFARCEPSVVRFYTAFNALSFISGASRLNILKKLLTAGVELYHVDSLHSKVVLVDGTHFSLGSQNLTVRGRRNNKEASFVSGHESPSKQVRDFFDDIHKFARLITLEDILKMEELIGPWMPKFKKIERGAREIDQEIEEERLVWEEAERLRKVEESRKRYQEAFADARRQRDQAMRRAINAASELFSMNQISSKIMARVRRLENASADIWRATTFTKSLVPDNKRDFLIPFSSIGVSPILLHRYLMINLDNGMLAYARLAKSRITFFASGLRPSEKFKFQSENFRVEIKFERDPEQLRSRNIVVNLVSEARGLGTVGSADFAFSVKGLEIQHVDVVPRNGFSSYELTHQTVEEALRSEEFEGFVIRWLTKPFKFERNLYGENAEEYFGVPTTSRYEVTAIRFRGSVVFSAREFPYLKKPAVIPDALLRAISDTFS